jgi:tetratricopeptide (TPR) repeat protein
VQGNPLALSLIAGWLRQEYRPGERHLQPLQQYPDLFQLQGKHRGESGSSVDRVLQWSIDRLTPERQHLLTQVSVLRGAFNYIAAATLALEQSVSDVDLRDLERRSLLQELSERGKDGLRSFRLQPRLRDFVQKQAPDLTTAHERAIGYFWSRRKTQFVPDDTQAVVMEYEETFYHQCQLQRYSEALATVWACDEFLRRRGYYQTLIDLYGQLHTHWQPTPEQQQDYAAVCNNLGNAYRALGQYKRAIEYQEQSLAITREIGDRSGEANSLGNLGIAYKSLGQYERAIEYQEQSLAITREIGDRWGEGASLFNLGIALVGLDRHAEALQNYQQALAIYEALKLDHIVERCKTAIAECNQSILSNSARQRLSRWQTWGLWFAVGVAIVLIIWWLRR